MSLRKSFLIGKIIVVVTVSRTGIMQKIWVQLDTFDDMNDSVHFSVLPAQAHFSSSFFVARAQKAGFDLSLLLPGKTNGHGSQGMARHRVVEAVGSGVEGSEAPCSEMAQGSAAVDMAAREAIQTSLVKAAARVIPVSDRITECRSFIERAERRVTKAEEAVEAAVSWKKQMEVEEGRARLRRLEEELEVQAVPVPTTSDLLRLQAMVSQLKVEKEELLRNASGSRSERPAVRVEDIAIMPNFIPAELAQWMDDRRVELQEALSQGDDAAVLEISSKMAKGAERMVQMKRHVPDDELAMRFSPGEGRFAPI